METKTKKLILIDGNSLINRAFFAIPSLNARDGSPTNAVFGFANMLLRLIETERPDYLAVVFDMRAPTFRHLRYDGYKATRKGMPEDLASQLPKLKELLGLMNIRCLGLEGYEADDLLGTIASKEETFTVIVTGDKDALQLVNNSTVVYLTKRGISDVETFDEAHFREVYGMEPQRMVDLKALMGDHSDNIPGVPGVGEKTALRLLSDYGSLDGVYGNVDQEKGALKEKLEQFRDSAYLSYELATICRTVPVEYRLEDFTYDYPFSAAVKNKFESYSFRTLAAKNIFTEGIKSIPAHVESHKIGTENFAGLDFSRGYAIYDSGDALHIAFDDRQEYRVPFGGDLFNPGETEEIVYAALPSLDDPHIGKVVFDYKAFKRLSRRAGRELCGAELDVQLAQYVLDCTKPNDSVGSVLDNWGLSAFSEFPAAALMKLRSMMKPELEQFRRVYYEIDAPLADVLFDMEELGMLVDVENLKESGEKLQAQAEELTAEIYGYAGHSFNIKSPMQIGQVLFDELGLEAGKKTKKKTYSTSADVLENLRGEHPIIDAILRYRLVTKLYGTYIEGMEKLLGADHVVHSAFKQTVTTTGRLSSAEPNLQNIPVRDEEGRILRKMFVARPGKIYLSADYSQIELRLMAHFSGEPSLIEAYKRGEDIHTATASQVFGVPMEAVTSGQRRDAKAVNFGVIYGISEYGLSKNIGISVMQARKYIQGYFLRYPRVKDYLESCVKEAHETGRLVTLTGRMRRFDNINSSNFQIRSFNERAAMNMPLQSTAADLIKLAMLRIDDALKARGLASRMVCQVHDELILECPEAEAGAVAELVRYEMENAMTLSVPLVAQVGTGKTWFDLK